LLIVIGSYICALLPRLWCKKISHKTPWTPCIALLFSPIRFCSPKRENANPVLIQLKRKVPSSNEIEQGGTKGEEERLTISTPGSVRLARGCPGEDLIRVHYGLRLAVPAGFLTLIHQKTALLFWDLSKFSRFDYLGTILELKITANSTYWMANLFSDDLKSMEMKRTPVLTIAFSRGSR